MGLRSIHIQFRAHGWAFTVAAWLTVLLPVLAIAGRAPLDIGATLIALCFVLRSAFTRDAAWLKILWVKLLLLLWLYMCVQSFWAADVHLAFGRSAAWVRYIVFAAALTFWVLPQPIVRRTLMKTLVFSLVFMIADGWLQYITGTDIFGRDGRVSAFNSTVSFMRLTGPFKGPQLGITLVWLTLPALCYLLGRYKAFYPSCVLAVLCSAMAITMIYLTGDRMAFIFIVFAFGVLTVLSTPLRMRAIASVFVAFCFIGVVNTMDAGLKARQIDQSSEEITNFSQSAYGQAWHAASMIIKDHRWFGVGAKHFAHACEAVHTPERITKNAEIFCPLHAHNFYLEWLTEFGAVGLGLFMAVVVQWLRFALPHWRLIWGDAMLSGLAVLLIIRFWPLAATASQFASWSAVPLWLAVAWFLALLQARLAGEPAKKNQP